MTRRALIAITVGAAQTPRNALAAAANAFQERYRSWAEAINATPPQTLSMPEVEAWEPLSRLWRAVETARRKWLTGCR